MIQKSRETGTKKENQCKREQKRKKCRHSLQKGKGEKRHILLRLGRYLWQFKGWLFLAILLSISSNLLSLAGPMYSGLCRRCDGWQGTGKYGACNLLL